MALIERGSSQLHAAQLFLLSRALSTPVERFFSTLGPGALPTEPVTTAATALALDNIQEELGVKSDGRSNQEVKKIVKAFSRIPEAERRSRILRIVQSLSNVNSIVEVDPIQQ